MNYFSLLRKKEKGVSLVEVLIASSLFLIVFLGIFSAYRLILKATAESKNKITATVIANGELEKIKNLSYESVGTIGGFPSGTLESSTTTTINNVDYTIERRIDYVVDSRDGIADPDDSCPNDYKRVEIKVSWPGTGNREVSLVSDVSPQTLAQECAETGGILSVSVFNAYGAMVDSPLIEIKNPDTDENIKTATPAEGKHFFSLPVGTYKVAVSKSGYSSERTYGIEEITTPEKPHPSVLEDQVTEISFSIDKTSSFSVDTLSSWGSDYFSDSFSDESKISELDNLTVGEGEVTLSATTTGYESSGYLISTSTAPANLLNWEEFSFNNSKPLNTQILYRILYFNGASWLLVPDADLPGNSTGFSSSPIDISGLAIADYPELEIKGNFSTTDASVTPVLYDWQLSWRTTDATPIGNVSFHLEGEKIIGTDASGTPVYKYSEDHLSNSSGHIDIAGLEWDNYTFSIDPSSGLDLVTINPSPQPVSLSPDASSSVSLYLESQNSLLVTVKDIDTGEPVFGASVNLHNSGLSYDKTQYTNDKGQTYFIPLDVETYTIDIQIGGYQLYSGSVSVSGDKSIVVSLTRIE